MAPAKHIRIDAIQTVTPATVTEPGRSRRVAVAGPILPEILQSRLRVVLYYKQASEEDSAKTVAAWIKESLSAALPEQPVLAGRLRREHEGDGYWEVKANDAGVRLVQATAEATTMAEFLASKDREGWEGQLAYWVDVDGKDPNFSALFCIQVTEFEGDGYSIGISCSLLLADPLFLARFLKKWAAIHSEMLAKGQLSKSPIFNLAYFQRPARPIHMKSTPLDSAPTASTATTTTTVLFKVPRPATHHAAAYDALAARCIEEVARTVDGRATPEFSLILSDHSGDLRVDSCCNKDGSSQTNGFFDVQLDVSWWDELGVEEMALTEGNKPVHVSYRIISAADLGLVVAMVPPSDAEGNSGLFITASVPLKRQ